MLAVGVFDLLHAGHLHYLEQAKLLGEELVVIVAHDDTVRQRKHEPITLQDMRKRMVEGLKPVDSVYIGNPPGISMFEILVDVKPDIIALGYDPIWFGIIVVKMAELCLITPPIGLNCFVVSGVRPDIPVQDVFRGCAPFFVADVLTVGVLIAFPSIVLFLPNAMQLS